MTNRNKPKFAVLNSIESFTNPRPSIIRRIKDGKALRKVLNIKQQGNYKPPKCRIDPITILENQAKTRIQSLIPIRYERMLQSPFGFYRGGAAIMAQDLANQPTTNIMVQLCGDMHVSNFGLFGTAEHRLVFGINDFDETLPGSWEWDLKRLVSSAVVACESIGGDKTLSKKLVMRICGEYQNKMNQYAQMPYLELAQEFIGEKEIRSHFSKEHQQSIDARLKESKGQGNIQVLQKLTTLVGKDRKIIDKPPLIEHFKLNSHGIPLHQLIDKALINYSSTLLADRKVLFERYLLKDFARKVVGIGSVGTNCMILYFEGDSEKDPLFLQYKEAQRSVLSPYLGESIYRDMGLRVVAGQRLLQGAPDIFLNYGSVQFDLTKGEGFYLRQLRDMKGGIDLGPGGISLKNFSDYARLFGWALALGHARSGDAAMIAGYCGENDDFGDAFYAFARAYAKQNEQDYETFKKAVKNRKINASRN